MKIANKKHDFNSAMIGIILFDGSMMNEHVLYVRHGGKQITYVDEKVEYISKYIKPTSINSSIDKKGYEYRYAYYNSDKLKYLYNNIYKNGKKKLTSTILNRFNYITLAFMYMDDGSLVLRKDNKSDCYKSREIYLATHSFTTSEVEMLQSKLKSKFDLEFRLSYDKGKPRLWCNTKNTIKFLEIVCPIVKEFPTMHYKLDLKYKNKNIKFI